MNETVDAETPLSSEEESAKAIQRQSQARLWQSLIGLVFIFNSIVIKYLDADNSMNAGFSAMLGAIILGYPIVLTTIKNLKNGTITINELVSLAVVAAFAKGDYRTAGVIAFLMLLGEVIETRTAVGARASIESLIKLTPKRARRLTKDKKEEEIPSDNLKIGDTFRVLPGENIPADGVIVKGVGSINQANVTGESLPVDKKVGDDVFAGTINLTGALDVKVSRAGQDTTLGKVRELILAAEKTRLPIMRIIEQYIGFYTPFVLVMGALVWAFSHDLDRVIAVLLVACPGAFILATPTAMVAAISSAARLGVLVKNVADLELAAKINAFVFDKTGTLTEGRLVISQLRPADNIKPAVLLRLAASAEQRSNHPVAKALVNLARDVGITLDDPEDFKETAGRGVEARVDNTNLVVGRAQWLKDAGVTDDFMKSVNLDETEGYSLIFAAQDKKFLGWIGLQDEIRSEAKETLTQLKEHGVRRIAMVTGDREPVARRVAREIGCEEVAADCLPQNKVEFVSELRDSGYRVAVVGDGVNDAPALAAGDISIAMGAAGSDVAIHSATIALMNNDLRRLPFLVQLSRSTRAIINQNFLFGVLFIIGGLSLAAIGYLTPILAATLQLIGSIIVIFNSARLVRSGENLEPSQNQTEPEPSEDTGIPEPVTV